MEAATGIYRYLQQNWGFWLNCSSKIIKSCMKMTTKKMVPRNIHSKLKTCFIKHKVEYNLLCQQPIDRLECTCLVLLLYDIVSKQVYKISNWIPFKDTTPNEIDVAFVPTVLSCVLWRRLQQPGTTFCKCFWRFINILSRYLLIFFIYYQVLIS